MSTDSIIQHVLEGDVASAKAETEILLYDKLNDILQLATEEVATGVYEDAVGVASLVEKKKKQKLDPVGSEDEDIDNDGDSDESDSYLKNRRGVVGFSIRRRKDDDNE